MTQKPSIIVAFDNWAKTQGISRLSFDPGDAIENALLGAVVDRMKSNLAPATASAKHYVLELLRGVAAKFPSKFKSEDDWLFCEENYDSAIEMFLQYVASEALCQERNSTHYGPGSVLVRCVPLGTIDASVVERDGSIFIVVSNELIAFLWVYNWAISELLTQALNAVRPAGEIKVSNTVGAKVVATYLLQNIAGERVRMPFLGVVMCLLDESYEDFEINPLPYLAQLLGEVYDRQVGEFANNLLNKGHVDWKDNVSRRIASLKIYALMQIVLHELSHQLYATLGSGGTVEPRQITEEVNVDTMATLFLEDVTKTKHSHSEPIAPTLGPAVFLSAIRLFIFLDFDRRKETLSGKHYADLGKVFPGSQLVWEQNVLDERIFYALLTRMLRGSGEELERLFRAIVELDVYNLFFVSHFVDRPANGKINLRTTFPRSSYLQLINEQTIQRNWALFEKAKAGVEILRARRGK